MEHKIIFLYSGQGSQYFHMGRELYRSSPVFRQVLDACEDSYRAVRGISMLEVIFDSSVERHDPFDQTCVTHPALVAIQVGLSSLLAEAGIVPDAVLGYSVGELAAAVVAGSLEVEPAVRFATQQAALLEDLCSPGSMMAILASLSVMDAEPTLFAGCELAAHNLAQHFVVAGSREALARLRLALVDREIPAQILPVSQAFHSSFMKPAEAAMRSVAQELRGQPDRLPRISSTLAAEVALSWPDFLWQVARQPVRFKDTIDALEAMGPKIYVDLGPSATLANFLKYALGDGSRSIVLSGLRRTGHEERCMADLVEKLRTHTAGRGRKRETTMSEEARAFRMEHSIDVDTSQENAFNLINAVEDWADIFPPCQQARVVERDGSWRTIEVTAQVGESVRTWRSRRRLHADKHKVDFEQQDPFPPIDSMAGYWQVSSVGEASRITLVHEFATSSRRAAQAEPPLDLEAAETWIRDICDSNSEKELKAFKEACEAREFAAAT